MKKKSLLVLLFGMMFTSSVVLTSCMSMMMSLGTSMAKNQYKDYGVYESSVPADQLSDFRFMFVDIKSFDGKPVSWKDNASGGNNTGHIKVPAGTHDIVFDWIAEESITTSSTSGNTITYTTITITRSKKDISIKSVNFEAGHNYFLGGGQLADGSLKIHILDQTSMPSEFYGDIVADAPKKAKVPTELEGTWKNSTDGQVFVFAGNTWEQTIPPNTGTNEGKNEIQMRGTFQNDNGVITLYSTDTRIDKGKWITINALKQAYLYKYSLNGVNLDLELEDVLPNTTYLKQ